MASDRDAEEEMVRAAIPLVTHCVASVAARVPRHVRPDELVSAGLLGLAQAAKSWDADRGTPFEHYARQRIKGALLDELRGRDWASRSARHDGRRLRTVTEELTSRLRRAPADDEVAAELGITPADVVGIRNDLERSVVLHLDGMVDQGHAGGVLADEPSTDPANHVLGREMNSYLHDAVLALPERLRKIMVEYFFEERPMQEIADDLGITVSRVSQLRAQAIRQMREGLEAQFAEAPVAPVRPIGRLDRKRADYAASIAASSTSASRVSSSTPGLLERAISVG